VRKVQSPDAVRVLDDTVESCALARTQELPHTQSYHFYANIVAFVKMETYRVFTTLNHFALKTKLYQAAIASAHQEYNRLKAACLAATIT